MSGRRGYARPTEVGDRVEIDDLHDDETAEEKALRARLFPAPKQHSDYTKFTWIFVNDPFDDKIIDGVAEDVESAVPQLPAGGDSE